MKIAGLMTVKNYVDDCSAFQTLKALSDITIILDDNSRTEFKYKQECDEYLSLRNHSPWNDMGNRTLLMYRAFVHGCTWVVCMDDDIIFSNNFQSRADTVRLIDELEDGKQDTCFFTLRDLWDSDDQFRYDGIWGRKVFAVLRRNWFYSPAITMPDPAKRLHSPIHPPNLRPSNYFPKDYTAYHSGCCTHEKRIRRVEKYKIEDPKNHFQRNYSYMLNTGGLLLAPVPNDDLIIIKSKKSLE